MHMIKWGVQLVARELPRAPGYNTSPLTEVGQQEFFFLGQSYVWRTINYKICILFALGWHYWE